MDGEYRRAFGLRLQELRDVVYAGLSYASIGERWNTTGTTAQNWLDGTHLPNAENVSVIAKDSGVSLSWLVYGDGAMFGRLAFSTLAVAGQAARLAVPPTLHAVQARASEVLTVNPHHLLVCDAQPMPGEWACARDGIEPWGIIPHKVFYECEDTIAVPADASMPPQRTTRRRAEVLMRIWGVAI